MGKLRAVKKSRGHYVVKKGTNLDVQDSASTSGLESVTLHTKEQSFSSSSKTNKSVSQDLCHYIVGHNRRQTYHVYVLSRVQKLRLY